MRNCKQFIVCASDKVHLRRGWGISFSSDDRCSHKNLAIQYREDSLFL